MITALSVRRVHPFQISAMAAGLVICLWALAHGHSDVPPPDIDGCIDRAAGLVESKCPDDRWIENADADAIYHALLDDQLTEEQWQRLLDQSCIAALRPVWRSDTRLVMRARCPLWAGPRAVIRIKCPDLSPHWSDGVFSQRGRSPKHADRYTDRATGITMLCEALPIGEHVFRFDVQILVRFAALPGQCAREVQRKGTITRSVTVVEEHALTPIVTPDLERVVRDSIQVLVKGRTGDPASLVARTQATPDLIAIGEGMGLRIVIELFDENGAVLDSLLVPLDCSTPSNSFTTLQLEDAFEIPSPNRAAQWKVKVRGDESAVLLDGRFDRYWAGEYEIPFVEVLRDRREPEGEDRAE